MDFGVVGIDGLVSSETVFSSLASEDETGQKGIGSGYSKQGRSGSAEDEWSGFKMAKTDTMMMQPRTSTSLRSNSLSQDQAQLLSFSAGRREASVLISDAVAERSSQNGSFGVYHSSGAYGTNSGVGAGSLSGSMHGFLAGIRGPFTPSQWMELEHQALIYKYLNANVPIPSNLLMSIRRPFNPVGDSNFAPASFRSNQLGWGSFHLSFSGNTDPEPGRCRRTDGKKWRCSRDAVADQKYCERHLNRGRHRSRKPVEGQTGHTVSGPASAVAKTLPISLAAAAGLTSSASNNLSIAHQQPKSINMSTDPSSTHVGRISLNKPSRGNQMQVSQSVSFGNMFLPALNRHAPIEESSKIEFGLVSSDSVLNPIRSTYSQNPCFNSSHEDQEPQSHPLRDFIDNWQGRQSDRLSLSWPEVEDTQSDRMQLSISIPVSDFSSSSSSPTQEKLTLSPLRAPCELDSIQMNLGLGDILNGTTKRQSDWRAISWEASMGGPLGEVLHNSSNSSGDFKTMSLMTEGWDSSPRLESSPTGVLQKATFVSLSNSSTASSPRAENNKSNDFSTSFGDDLLGPDLVNSSIQSL